MRTPIEIMIDKVCGYNPNVKLSRCAMEHEKRQAYNLASEVIDHIDKMYPVVWTGAPKTARISIRNTIYNRVITLLTNRDGGSDQALVAKGGKG